ncbi:hypothetical protein [Marinicellulosiphila megalodicopiae]|uniref:hypothetical protein n=1 Tax=Marinicellulosiphila megalodicopiae TaxID=2724896 RepID=UPI003BAE9774
MKNKNKNKKLKEVNENKIPDVKSYKELFKENRKFIFLVVIFITLSAITVPQIFTIPVGWVINSTITYEFNNYSYARGSGFQVVYYLQLVGENNLKELGFFIYIFAIILYVFLLGVGSVLFKYIKGDKHVEYKLLVLLLPLFVTLLIFKIDTSHVILKFLINTY